jgi:hypothetical protein
MEQRLTQQFNSNNIINADTQQEMSTIAYPCVEEWCLLGLLRHVALVKTQVSEELSTSIIRVKRVGD